VRTQEVYFTTLQKAADRLQLKPLARRLLDATVRDQLKRCLRVPLAAIDSTGLECTAASAYFVRRRATVGSPWKSVVLSSFPETERELRLRLALHPRLRHVAWAAARRRRLPAVLGRRVAPREASGLSN